MKAYIIFFRLSAVLFFAAGTFIGNASQHSDNSKAIEFIRTSCNATLYPELCYASLSTYANTIQQSPAHLAGVAVAVSLASASQMASYVANLSSQADQVAEPGTAAAAALDDCLSTFRDAVDLIGGSLKEMKRLKAGRSFRFRMSNVQTWMSAALTNEETCTDGFQDVPDGAMKSEVCDRAGSVKKFTSNALALVNSYVSKVVTNSTETP